MTRPSLTDLGGGEFTLHGRLDPSNAGPTLLAGQENFRDHDRITVDIGQADCTSSVGMALLLEWSTWSIAKGKWLSYKSASRRLIELIELNGVEDLLQISVKRE